MVAVVRHYGIPVVCVASTFLPLGAPRFAAPTSTPPSRPRACASRVCPVTRTHARAPTTPPPRQVGAAEERYQKEARQLTKQLATERGERAAEKVAGMKLAAELRAVLGQVFGQLIIDDKQRHVTGEKLRGQTRRKDLFGNSA